MPTQSQQQRAYYFHATDGQAQALDALLPAIGVAFKSTEQLIHRSSETPPAFIATWGPKILDAINGQLATEGYPALPHWHTLDPPSRYAVLELAHHVIESGPAEGFRIYESAKPIAKQVQTFLQLASLTTNLSEDRPAAFPQRYQFELQATEEQATRAAHSLKASGIDFDPKRDLVIMASGWSIDSGTLDDFINALNRFCEKRGVRKQVRPREEFSVSQTHELLNLAAGSIPDIYEPGELYVDDPADLELKIDQMEGIFIETTHPGA